MRIILIILAGSILAGCSVHPLTEETTGLTSYQLIHKLRCEAHYGLLEMVESRGLAPLRPGLIVANKKISALKEAFKKGDRLEKGLNKERASLISRRERIDLDLRKIRSDQAALLDDKRQKNPKTEPSLTDQEIADFDARNAAQNSDSIQWEEDAVDYRIRANAHNVKVIEAATVLSEVEGDRSKKFKPLIDFYGNQTAFQFRFEITQTASATAAGKVTVPIHAGNIAVELGAGSTRERYSERAIKLAASFEALLDLKCDDVAEGNVRAARRYPIIGNIGLKETFEQYMLVAAGGTKFQKQGESYVDEIKFTTTINGNLKPQFVISPAAPRVSGSGSIDVGGKRIDLHEVIVFLSPPTSDPPATEKITNVRLIEDFPGLGPSN